MVKRRRDVSSSESSWERVPERRDTQPVVTDSPDYGADVVDENIRTSSEKDDGSADVPSKKEMEVSPTKSPDREKPKSEAAEACEESEEEEDAESEYCLNIIKNLPSDDERVVTYRKHLERMKGEESDTVEAVDDSSTTIDLLADYETRVGGHSKEMLKEVQSKLKAHHGEGERIFKVKRKPAFKAKPRLVLKEIPNYTSSSF